MTNGEAVCGLCTAVCSAFYPDGAAVEMAMRAHGVDGDAEARGNDPDVFRAARDLCVGFVEASRSEGGVSVSVRDSDAVLRALRHWCRVYGLDEAEVPDDTLRVIRDGSHRW